MSLFAKPSADASLRHDAMRGAALGLIVGLLYFLAVNPAFNRQRQTAWRSSCQTNLKQIGLGFKQYITDYDEKYPLAAFPGNHAKGWADALESYLKNAAVYQCPAERHPTTEGYTDFWLNSNLSVRGALSESAFTNIQSTVLCGNGINGSESYARNSEEGEGSPAANLRHLGGANYLFADGHVKWFKPGSITNEPPQGANYTFRYK